MSQRFFGHAAVFETPDRENFVFKRGCFTQFLKSADVTKIPMLDGHHANLPHLGTWLYLHEDEFGLFAIGEVHSSFEPLIQLKSGISAGVSVKPHQQSTVAGNQIVSVVDHIFEISLSPGPKHPQAKIVGPWAGPA